MEPLLFTKSWYRRSRYILSPSEIAPGKSKGSNRAILLNMQRTYKAALADAKLRANSASEEEYLRKRGSLEDEAPATKKNPVVPFSSLKAGG